MLAGFSCIDLDVPRQGREIACFRKISSDLLDEYFRNYESSYQSKELEYLRDARKCSVGNGDATLVPAELFPPVFKIVAKPRFGFQLHIGTESKSLAYHGYADLDPDIGLGPQALEVFDLFLNYKGLEVPKADGPSIPSAQFELQVDNLPQARENIVAAMERQYGLPVVAKVRSVSFTYRGTEEVSLDVRRNDLQLWEDGIGTILLKAGFNPPDPSIFANAPFHDEKGLRDYIVSHLAYGLRDSHHQTVAEHMVYLIGDPTDPCTEIAEVLVWEPEEGVRSDYGVIMTELIGAGDCRKAQKKGGMLSEELLERLTEYLSGVAAKNNQ
jgi:hypothetical protein